MAAGCWRKTHYNEELDLKDLSDYSRTARRKKKEGGGTGRDVGRIEETNVSVGDIVYFLLWSQRQLPCHTTVVTWSPSAASGPFVL